MDSMAVLKSSIMITNEMVKRRIVHSVRLKRKMMARVRTVRAARVWMRKLGSFLKAVWKP